MTSNKKEYPSNFKSYLKSASFEKLLEMEKSLSEEIVKRRQKPQRIQQVVTYTDGASRGNPGLAGVGVLLFDQNGEKILQDYQFIGTCTNNEAEYRALLLALDRALEVTQERVDCFMDSELLVRQLNGQYEIKSEKLMKFYDEVKRRVQKFDQVTFTHVPREHPKLKLADQLANRAIDEMAQGGQ